MNRKGIWISLECFLAFFVLLFLPPIQGEAKGKWIDHPNWIESSVNEINQKRNNGENFVVVFYERNKEACEAAKSTILSWVRDYNALLYGVEEAMPDWARESILFYGSDLPVFTFVKWGYVVSYNDIVASEDQLASQIELYSKSDLNFLEINRATYQTYITHEESIRARSREMAAQVDDSIRKQAEEIVQGLTADRDKLKAIYTWIAENIYYDMASSGDSVSMRTALRAFNNRYTVCAGYASLMNAMCNAVGIPCRDADGFAAGSGAYTWRVWKYYQQYLKDGNRELFLQNVDGYADNHAWNEVYLEGRWILLDVTWGSRNRYYKGNNMWEKGEINWFYYDMSLEEISRTHLFYEEDGYVIRLVAGEEISIWDTTLRGREGETLSITEELILEDFDFFFRSLRETLIGWSGKPNDRKAEFPKNTTIRLDQDYVLYGVWVADLPGDINGDGQVNIFDVIRLLKYVTGEAVYVYDDPDVNGDFQENIFDVIRLLKFVTGENVEIY